MQVQSFFPEEEFTLPTRCELGVSGWWWGNQTYLPEYHWSPLVLTPLPLPTSDRPTIGPWPQVMSYIYFLSPHPIAPRHWHRSRQGSLEPRSQPLDGGGSIPLLRSPYCFAHPSPHLFFSPPLSWSSSPPSTHTPVPWKKPARRKIDVRSVSRWLRRRVTRPGGPFHPPLKLLVSMRTRTRTRKRCSIPSCIGKEQGRGMERWAETDNWTGDSWVPPVVSRSVISWKKCPGPGLRHC